MPKHTKEEVKAVSDLIMQGYNMTEIKSMLNISREFIRKVIKTNPDLYWKSINNVHKRKGDDALFISLIKSGVVASVAQRESKIASSRAQLLIELDPQLKEIAKQNREKMYENRTRLYRC